MTNPSKVDPKQLVLKAIASYNRYRSPEATAKLVKLQKDKFTIEFSGPFCLGCGVSDYFEDFIYELKDPNHQAKMKQFKRTGPQSYEVEYSILIGERKTD
jgi:hypothetical protein